MLGAHLCFKQLVTTTAFLCLSSSYAAIATESLTLKPAMSQTVTNAQVLDSSQLPVTSEEKSLTCDSPDQTKFPSTVVDGNGEAEHDISLNSVQPKPAGDLQSISGVSPLPASGCQSQLRSCTSCNNFRWAVPTLGNNQVVEFSLNWPPYKKQLVENGARCESQPTTDHHICWNVNRYCSQLRNSKALTDYLSGIRVEPSDQPSTRQPPTNFNSPLAETNPGLPPGILTPDRPLPPLPTTPPETPTPIPPLTPPPETLPNLPAELEVKVQVERVEVLGSTVFSPEELQAVVASFIGKEATFEELLAMRTAITRLYTDNGYTTSGAFLPSQDLTEGVVMIQVVEGGIERIEIEGLKHLRRDYVQDRISLATQTPVNLRRLEVALQLLQLDPLFDTVQAELSAGTAPGLSILKLNVTETPRVTVAVIGQNQDSPGVGSLRGTVAIANHNLFGFGDRLSAEYSLTAGIDSYNFRYQIPLNPHSGTLSFFYGRSRSELIEEPFSRLDINAQSSDLSLSFRQPLVYTPSTEFILSLSFDWRRSETFLLGDIPFSFSIGPETGRSQASVLRFSQEWTNRSATTVLAARSQFSFGLDAFNATIDKRGPDGRFMSWLGQFQWVQALGGNTILIARAGAQLTNDSLLPLEQFSIGGVDTVRGYRQNQRVADNGIVGSLEVRFPLVRDPDGIGTIQLAPFFDIGKVWNHNGEVIDVNTFASIGLGLRWQLDPYISAQLEWGIPLISVPDEGNTLQDHGITFFFRFQPF